MQSNILPRSCCKLLYLSRNFLISTVKSTSFFLSLALWPFFILELFYKHECLIQDLPILCKINYFPWLTNLSTCGGVFFKRGVKDLKDSGTDVFLWVLRNFQDYFFIEHRATASAFLINHYISPFLIFVFFYLFLTCRLYLSLERCCCKSSVRILYLIQIRWALVIEIIHSHARFMTFVRYFWSILINWSRLIK